jgi:ParB family chromosome partitioning protein
MDPVASWEGVMDPVPSREARGSLKVRLIDVDRVVIGDRHRKDMGDLDALAQSIREVGLLQPIVVKELKGGPGAAENDRYLLIAGERRLRAVRDKLKHRCIDAYHVTGFGQAADLLRAERDENTCRKDFTPTEAVAIGKALEQLEKGKARDRQEASRARKGAKVGAKGGGNLPPPSGGRGKTRDKVAAAVGMSGRTYEKAKQVVEAAEADPERFGDLTAAMDEGGNVHKAHVEMRRRRRAGAREEELRARARAAGDKGRRPWRVETADCRAWLRASKPATARLIFADPPYNIGVDYGEGAGADALPGREYMARVAG